MLKEEITYSEGENELQKFFSLLNLQGDNSKMKMPKCFVDTVWHEKLENEKSYEEFCLENVGKKVEHVETKGVGEMEWVKDYEEKHGKLPPIWFTNTKGDVDKDLFHKYIENGDVILEWTCGPMVTTP